MVTDVAWIKQAARFFAFLMPGMLRVFPTAEAAKARDWIVNPPKVIYVSRALTFYLAPSGGVRNPV